MALIKFQWVKDDRNDNVLFESRPKDKKKESRKGLMINWMKKYDWDKDPFIDEILFPAHEFMSGYEDERKHINMFLVQNQNFGLISGKPGSGKTSILIWLNDELTAFKDKYKIVYLPAKDFKSDFTYNLVKHFLSISVFNKDYTPSQAFDKINKNMPKSKKTIILVDDIHELNENSFTLFREMISSLKNFILIGTVNHEQKHELIQKLGKEHLNIELKELSFDGVHEMIKKRIESVGGIDIDPFSVVQLKTLTKKVSGNPREILFLCSKKAAEIAFEGKDPDAKVADIDSDELQEIEAELALYNKNNENLETKESSDNVKNDDAKSDEVKIYEGDLIVQEVLGGQKKDSPKEKSHKKTKIEEDHKKKKTKK